MNRTLARAILAVGCVAAVCSAALAADGPRLPKVRDFHLTTTLVEDGKPTAFIVAPKGGAYRQLVARLQAHIAKLSGATLDIVADTEVTDAHLAARHAIVLGNLMTNKLAARLYCIEQLDVDAAWPGKGGHLLQSVHNPLGTGRNVISLGGSDTAGVAASLDAFLKGLKAGKTLAVGPLFVLKTAAKGPGPLPTAAMEAMLKGLKGRGYRNIGGRAASYGSTLRKWNTPGYATLFRRTIELLWDEMDKLKVCDDLRTTKFLPLIWDTIEERAEFTDADRAYISHFMYVHAHKVPYAHSNVRASTRPHGNNWNARGSYIAGRYIATYYPDLEIGQRLMTRMDRYYKADMVHWKVSEDCPGYGDITLRANLFYALTRPDMSYFENGNVRKAADYDMLITNNSGIVSGFGDARGRKYAVSVLPMAAWYYRDGSTLWWWRKCGGSGARFQVDDLKEEPPARLLGVKAAPLDAWIYKRRQARMVPHAKCFDKMSFRAGFEPHQHYLCLSGFSYGFHSHPDGNAIVHFSDNGHTFLFDDGYMVPEMSEHNTVVVFRQGRGAALPELVSLDHRADFSAVGLTRTTIAGYNGTRWSRNILWEKERFFLVIDQLEAEADSEFGFQTIWRTKGNVALAGRELTADQDGHVMHLLNLSGDTQSIKACHAKHPFGRRLVQSTPATLKQGEAATVANLFYVQGPDEKLDIAAESVAPGVAIVRQGDDAALMGVGPCREGVVATDAALFRVSGSTVHAVGATKLACSAPLFAADRPVAVTLDLAKGRGVVEAPEAITLQLPHCGKSLKLAKGRSVITFKVASADSIGKRQAQLSALFAQRLAARREAERKAAAQQPLKVTRLWSYHAFDLLTDRTGTATVTSTATPLTQQEANFRVGTLPKLRARNGNVMFPTGKPVTLTFDLGAPCDIQRVTIRSRQLVSFLGGCGVSKMTIAVSNDGFKADARPFGQRAERTMPPQNARVDYDIDAKPMRARQVRIDLAPLTPKHRVYIDSVGIQGQATPVERRKANFALQWVEACDLDGDGRTEVVVGSDDHCVYALGPDGKRRWKTQHGGRIYQFAATDLDGDGKGDVVVGCANKHLYWIDAAGILRRDIAPPPRTYARPHYRGVLPFQGPLKIVFASDLDGDGKQEIAVGSGNWRVYAYTHDGTLLWDECNWAHQPTCGTAFDLDGDGVKDVLMGNDYSSAHAYNGKSGKILISYGMSGHAGPSAIDAADADADGKADVVLGDRMGRITFAYPWNTRKRQSLEVGAPITFAKMADLDGDGKKETVVGSMNCYLYVFDAHRKLRWQKNTGEVPRDLTVADADGDGTLDLLVASDDNALHIYDAGGNEIGRFPAGGRVRHVRLARLGGGKAACEFVIACDGGVVHALRFAR